MNDNEELPADLEAVAEKYRTHFQSIRDVVRNVFETVELDDYLATEWLGRSIVLLVERDGIRFVASDRLKIKKPGDRSDPGIGLYL